jgi:chromosome segregation ATPase
MSNDEVNEENYFELKKRLNDVIESDNNKKIKIKELEIKNSELTKKNFEFQSYLQNIIIKMNLISQENSSLKLDIKKLQLSVNSPGKIVASLGTSHNKDLNTDNLMKEKSELKEENEKLVLMLSDRESTLSKKKLEFENEINDLNKVITELKGKINDINNDMEDIQNQLNLKEKEIQKLKEENNKKYGEKEQKEFKKLKIEYELLIQKLEESEKLNSDLEEKCNLYQNENKSLNDRVIKIEQAFNNLIESKNPKIKDIADLEIHNGISQNLRIELNEILDSRDKLEKTNKETNLKFKEDYKLLENKYLDIFNQYENVQKQIEESQNSFISDTMKLNSEISNLNRQIKAVEKERDDCKNKYQNLLKELESNKNNFDNLQKIMTKLREKDDIDITLIEERYIVLENVLEQEKNELVNTNKNLINKIKFLNQANNISDNGAPGLENNGDKMSSLDLEIKNLKEENKLLKMRIKEQEKRFFELQKKTDILNILKEENKLLKKNLKENEINMKKVIKDLNNKTSQLNEELLESRKRTSLLRSKQSFDDENAMKPINIEIENYKQQIELLKNEIETQKQKDKEEIELLEGKLSAVRAQIAENDFNKDNEIMKYKNLSKKYRDILESNGLLKKK